MKRILGFILTIIGIILFFSLYLISVFLKESKYFIYILFITGYISISIFIVGFILLLKNRIPSLKHQDIEIYNAIKQEAKRQKEHIELIASENYVSCNVLRSVGSILTNKYAEGYPNKRYYGGCENVDVIEKLAIDRVCKLFNCKFANVQPHSGSQANMAVYRAILKTNDVVLSLSLSDGGHLTHGHNLSFSGQDYNFIHYVVNKETGLIDYSDLEEKVTTLKPKLIVAGASAYPRKIDFEKFAEIAHKNNCLLMVDMAHIAGLVACGLHQNPLDYADVVTSTTHKTLRGPRGGIILTNSEELIKKINQTVFPGIQGGPLMHIIAGKAVAFNEALSEDFKTYQENVIKNSKALATSLINLGFDVITGGTDNHMILVNVLKTHNITGKDAESILHSVNITCNKNTVPNDTQKPFITSGIRLGTPSITTRGMKEDDMLVIADFINRALTIKDEEQLNKLRKEVIKFTKKFKVKF